MVLTGDVHRSWVADLKANFDDPGSATIGTEFVGTSISSTGDGSDDQQLPVRAANPHLRFYEDRRGYMRCELDAERWRTDVRAVAFVSRPGAPITTSASSWSSTERRGAACMTRPRRWAFAGPADADLGFGPARTFFMRPRKIDHAALSAKLVATQDTSNLTINCVPSGAIGVKAHALSDRPRW